jgi:hypothetical protein
MADNNPNFYQEDNNDTPGSPSRGILISKKTARGSSGVANRIVSHKL